MTNNDLEILRVLNWPKPWQFPIDLIQHDDLVRREFEASQDEDLEPSILHAVRPFGLTLMRGLLGKDIYQRLTESILPTDFSDPPALRTHGNPDWAAEFVLLAIDFCPVVACICASTTQFEDHYADIATLDQLLDRAGLGGPLIQSTRTQNALLVAGARAIFRVYCERDDELLAAGMTDVLSAFLLPRSDSATLDVHRPLELPNGLLNEARLRLPKRN